MHLQQTKADSRKSGGPQYYFHKVPAHVKEFLRRRGACPVVLHTPYGITSSPFMAVGKDHKLGEQGEILDGKVGHDRIQGEVSVGEEIRRWYCLPRNADFRRIEVDVNIHPEGHFILVPTAISMRGGKRLRQLPRIPSPLAFHRDYQSRLWRGQIEEQLRLAPDKVSWSAEQIKRVVLQHQDAQSRNIHEADLLRVSGALHFLGVDLGPYKTTGYDCLDSHFTFAAFPSYACPVEIKKRSSGFNYQVLRYAKLPRAVVLCLEHDLVNAPEHIDVLELAALAHYFTR